MRVDRPVHPIDEDPHDDGLDITDFELDPDYDDLKDK